MGKTDMGGLNFTAYSDIGSVLFSQDYLIDRRLVSPGT